MWPWIKRWRDWAMHDLWPLSRIGAQPQALGYSFEKAGLTLHSQPIPWNAEAVLVEAQFRRRREMPRKGDFALRLPGCELLPADGLRRDDADERYRLFFRFPTPPYSREKLHVLLTIDAARTDMKRYTCAGCLREQMRP